MTTVLPLVSALSVVGAPADVRFFVSPPLSVYFFETVFPSSYDSTISNELPFWTTFNVIFGSVLAACSAFTAVKVKVPEKSGLS